MATNTIPGPPIDGTPMRVTMFMQSPKKTWSETHWYRSASSYAAVALAADTLVSYRVRLMGSDGVLLALRISKDNVFRDGRLEKGPFPFPPQPVGGDPCDLVWTDVLLSASSNDVYHKSLFLGGIPDSMTIAENFAPSNLWKTSFSLYQQELNANWAFLAQSKEVAPATPAAPVVQNVSLSSLGIGVNWTVVTKAAHGLAVGDQVRVGGVKGQLNLVGQLTTIKPLNHRWLVKTVPDATSYTLDSSDGIDPASFKITAPGTTHKLIRTIVPYTEVEYGFLSSRKRGARSFLARGRSLTRTGINL